MIDPLSDDSKQSARQKVDRFVQRFDAAYRKLAYYAALPLVLTPELLNYLRNQFLRGEVPWVAEVDLLLSDLCSPTGYEQYVMNPTVRAVLLEEMEQVLGREQMEAVAQLLIDYVRKLSRTSPHLSDRSLKAQQWAAMVYLDHHRQTAVQQIARSLQDAITTGAGIDRAELSAANQAELAHLARITQELAPQLSRYTNLLEYASLVTQLLDDRTPIEAAAIERSYSVEGIELQIPAVGRAQSVGQEEAEERSDELPVIKVLVLISDPAGRLNLVQEMRELQSVFQRPDLKVRFDFHISVRAQPEDLQELLIQHRPQIVQFSGSGMGEEGLGFEDSEGRLQLVSTAALSNLFSPFSDEIKCLLLNASYSAVQANELVRWIDYVIGVEQNITNNAAIAFAKGFYRALGDGISIEAAYELGWNEVLLEAKGSPGEVLEGLNKQKPILKKKSDITARIEERSNTDTLAYSSLFDKLFLKIRNSAALERSTSRAEQDLSSKKTILFLAIDSGFSSLQLDQEIQEIAGTLRKIRQRDRFSLQMGRVSNVGDMQRTVLRIMPQILYIAGKNQNEQGLVFEDSMGQKEFVSEEALRDLFRLFEDSIECVILSRCYSEVQANVISEHISYVVGLPWEMQNESVVNFFRGFYNALGTEKSYEVAFRSGCLIPDLDDIVAGIRSPQPVLKVNNKLFQRFSNRGSQSGQERKKVLLIAFNITADRIRATEENQMISEELRRLDLRDEISLHLLLALRPADLSRAILEHEPDIVHFSVSGSEGIVLENDAGRIQTVRAEVLADLFRLLQPQIECVVLSKCYSEVQANAIHQSVDCVIGLDHTIEDRAAIEFAVGFYTALARGRSYEEAFNFGRAAIELQQ